MIKWCLHCALKGILKDAWKTLWWARSAGPRNRFNTWTSQLTQRTMITCTLITLQIFCLIKATVMNSFPLHPFMHWMIRFMIRFIPLEISLKPISWRSDSWMIQTFMSGRWSGGAWCQFGMWVPTWYFHNIFFFHFSRSGCAWQTSFQLLALDLQFWFTLLCRLSTGSRSFCLLV